MQITRSSYQFEVRAENDDKGTYISGRPIVYESKTNLGPFDEVIRVGALDKSDLRDVRFLVNHDTSKIPLARSRNNNANSTMQLSVDNGGMAIRVNLDTENNAEAKSLYSAVERGDISGMSFMFVIERDEWENLDSDHPIRNILEIKEVIEVSAVTFPAYEDTEINARSKETLDSVRRTLDNVRSKSLDSDNLELLKIKNRILGGI